MRKIGIITHPLNINYGGILQNYALQQILIKLGYSPITLRLSDPALKVKRTIYLVDVVKWIVKRILGRKISFPITTSKKSRILETNKKTMDFFVSKYIRCTPAKENLNIEDIDNYELEALIVGSDQVWRPKLVNNMLGNQFCGFAQDLPIKRIAYAASFGTDETEYSKELQEQTRKLVSKFSHISVREKGGVPLAKKYWGIDAEWVLDPTLLLDASDYEKLMIGETHTDEKYIFAYILDSTPQITNFIHNLAKQYKCKVKIVLCGPTQIQVPIVSWLALIRDAVYVITDSFHGSVFSILFQKQFVCINNISRGVSRMDNLKEVTGLSDRFVNELMEVPSEEIDYISVNERLAKYRKASLNYISNSLL